MTEAVLFDVGGVLIGPKPAAVTDLFWELAATRVPSDVAASSFAIADRAAYQADLAMSDDGSWARHWAHALGIDEAIGKSVHGRIAASPELTSRVWCHVNPEAALAMDRLRRAGIRLGMVSQSDGHLKSRLVAASLAHPGDILVDSGLVPWDKPDPAIYRHAAQLVGSHISRCAFLSDVMTDVEGAKRAGCADVTIFDPHQVWTDTDTPRVTSLSEFVDHCLGPADAGMLHYPIDS